MQRMERTPSGESVSFQEQSTRERLRLEYLHQAAVMLMRLGVPPRLSGYRFLKLAIALVAEQPDMLQCVTRELYPQVAFSSNTTPSCVERDIRNAIAVTWNRDGGCAYGELVTGTAACSYKPSNSELIAQVAERIRIMKKTN